ncbi:hypothetical protein SKAU_G00304310 [Synaphobranchus kaupii]|uniref:Uncharacterized protein n=1 Tax=Synaphobranchus kaupii TaxID=118154 RepID=A0A9Q1EWC5_SYNKA|nr:hypothetical protein SKAU_G00304310 [Synaphobranchus kaupii]
MERRAPSYTNVLQPSPDGSDEPAEKRERKEEKETKKKRDFYEKYRNPQKEKETDLIPIRDWETAFRAAIGIRSRVPCQGRDEDDVDLGPDNDGCRDGVPRGRNELRLTQQLSAE